MDFDNDSVGGRVIDAPDVPKPISAAELRKRRKLAAEIANAGWVGKPRRWRNRIERAMLFLVLSFLVLNAKHLPELGNRLNLQTMGFPVPWKTIASATPPAANNAPPAQAAVDYQKIDEIVNRRVDERVEEAMKKMAKAQAPPIIQPRPPPAPEPVLKITIAPDPFPKIPEKVVAKAVPSLKPTPPPTPAPPKPQAKPPQPVVLTPAEAKPKPRAVVADTEEERDEPRRTPQVSVPATSRLTGTVILPPHLQRPKGGNIKR